MDTNTTEMRRMIEALTEEIKSLERETSILVGKRKILSDKVAETVANKQGFIVGEPVKIKRINGKIYSGVVDSITSAGPCLYDDEFTVNVLPVYTKEDGSIVKAMATIPFAKEQCNIVDEEKIFIEGR